MNNPTIKHIALFVTLILTQVFIFDNIYLFGVISPFIYILFLILYPVKVNQILFLFLAFLLGLTMDFFSDTGGIHATACLVIAQVRPFILKHSFGVSYEYNSIKINQTALGERITYTSSMVFIHHLVLFSLEIFTISEMLSVFKFTLFSSIFTILMSLIFMIIFSSKKS